MPGGLMVVAYRNPAAPLRDLRIFRGFADVTSTVGNSNVDIPISGFLTPAAGAVNASVGLVAWEGESAPPEKGSSSTAPPVAATNPSNNSFDSASATRHPEHHPQPEPPQQFRHRRDRVSANGVLPNGQTSADVNQTTTGDYNYLGVVTTEIDLFTPSFNSGPRSCSTCPATPAQAGDTLEYRRAHQHRSGPDNSRGHRPPARQRRLHPGQYRRRTTPAARPEARPMPPATTR